MVFSRPARCRRFLQRSLVLLVTVLPLALAAPAHGQSSGEGSIYSRFGVGTLTQFSSPQAQAMGGGAYAVRSLNYNAVDNPALWSDQFFTRFLAGASYQNIDVEDGQGNTARLNGGALQALHVGIPLYERKLGVVLAFQPFSRSNYQVRETGTVGIGSPAPSPGGSLGDTQTETSYTVDFRGRGGLQLLRGGVGYRVTPWLRLGGAIDGVFGIVKNERQTSFGGQGTVVATRSDNVRMYGFSGTLGSHVALRDVLTEDDNLSVGGSVSLPVSLNGTRTRTLDDDDDITPVDTLGAAVDGTVTLPARTRLGVAYQFDQRWTFVLDGTYAPWSSFESDFADGTGAPFPTGGTDILDDQWSVSTGMEVVPAGSDPLAGYFARTGYRLGAGVERSYVQPSPTSDVYTWTGTAGVSLPTSLAGTRIDLTFTAGRRGTTDASLVRDTFYGFSLFVNFGERWFQERKLR